MQILFSYENIIGMQLSIQQAQITRLSELDISPKPLYIYSRICFRVGKFYQPSDLNQDKTMVSSGLGKIRKTHCQ